MDCNYTYVDFTYDNLFVLLEGHEGHMFHRVRKILSESFIQFHLFVQLSRDDRIQPCIIIFLSCIPGMCIYVSRVHVHMGGSRVKQNIWMQSSNNQCVVIPIKGI